MALATLYWYDKKGSLVDAILSAMEGFTKRQGYEPTIVAVREDEYEGKDFSNLAKLIQVGYSKDVTPSHFHLYPIVNKRTPVLSIVRRPYSD